MAFTLKQNDRRPHFVVALKDNYGEATEAAVDLTDATAAVFNMRSQGGTALKVDRGSCEISETPATGEVTYAWGTIDTNTVGTFDAEIEITWSDGKAETFPNNDYWEVEIVDDLG
jgi:hypothetical protein